MPKTYFLPRPSRSPVTTRRDFLNRSLLATALAAASAPALLRGQNLNGRLDVAVVGAGGKGATDTDECAKAGANIVALCDVDANTLSSRLAKYPAAKGYRDFRKLYEEMGKSFDAVIVSTPDHVHAPAASLAMKMGKHAYVQKPLTHSVAEARHLRLLAKEKKVVTQMGNQGSAGDGLRRAVEVIQAGIVGKPLELHVWSNRPIWPQGLDRPEGSDPVPAHLDWDLWLGPAPHRPYKEAAAGLDKEGKKRRGGVYHPFAWRGWKDFGTGALGDMACHTVNMPFRALKLGFPTAIEAEEVSDNHKETYAKSSRIRFEFPSREGLPPLKFWWYDGSPNDKTIHLLRPHDDLTTDIRALKGSLPSSGCLVVGDKGRLFSTDDYGSTFYMRLNDEKELKSHKEHGAVAAIPENFTRCPGGNHYKEWVDACKGGPTPYSNFAIAAYLTEIILLGCIAVRVGTGRKLDWDGPNMRAKNMDVASLVKRDYRPGWTL
ncbi:MAG: Gfo/Idh/MocA family oxidoreductase [Limisphaerales bacterium]